VRTAEGTETRGRREKRKSPRDKEIERQSGWTDRAKAEVRMQNAEGRIRTERKRETEYSRQETGAEGGAGGWRIR